MQVTNTKPDTILFPRIINNPSRLECRFGWNESSTKSFLENTFEKLVLKGGEGQPFSLPELGEKARALKFLTLNSSSTISGLEQFQCLQDIELLEHPDNALPDEIFHSLTSLFIEWDKRIANYFTLFRGLSSFGVSGFKGSSDLISEHLKSVKSIGFTQGNLKNLNFLSNFACLEDISLAYMHQLDDYSELGNSSKLSRVSLANLPRLSGEISFGCWQDLVEIKVVDCKKLTVNFSNISKCKKLEKVIVNTSCENIHFDELFSLPNILTISIPVAGVDISDNELVELSNETGRKISVLKRVGSKSNNIVQIEFD